MCNIDDPMSAPRTQEQFGPPTGPVAAARSSPERECARRCSRDPADTPDDGTATTPDTTNTGPRRESFRPIRRQEPLTLPVSQSPRTLALIRGCDPRTAQLSDPPRFELIAGGLRYLTFMHPPPISIGDSTNAAPLREPTTNRLWIESNLTAEASAHHRQLRATRKPLCGTHQGTDVPWVPSVP